MKLVPPNPAGLCMCGCGGATKLAAKSNRRDGYVKGEPVLFILGHQRVLSTPEYEEQDRGFSTPCWIWARGLDGKGYGQKNVQGRKATAYRLYYERERGPVPRGLELDHLCRVPSCVNPDHLEAVTHAENCRRGARTKLTVAQAREIKASDEKTSVLALRFGVAAATISNVRLGSTWKDIEAA